MELNLMQRILLSFMTGITDILPVAEKAHSVFLYKIFGAQGREGLYPFFLHLGVLFAMYQYSRPQIQKMMRANALAKIPKKRRKRPLDAKSLMDYRFLKTMAIPVILSLFAYVKIRHITFSLVSISIMLILNGIILYIPQFFPTSNKDCRSLSRLEGLGMGCGGILAILPGFSGLGAAISVGSICGVERKYCLDMTVLLNMIICFGWLIYDLLEIVSEGLAGLSFSMLGQFLLCGCIAFVGAWLALRLLKAMATHGFSIFSFYCWGIALLIFILNLIA